MTSPWTRPADTAQVPADGHIPVPASSPEIAGPSPLRRGRACGTCGRADGRSSDRVPLMSGSVSSPALSSGGDCAAVGVSGGSRRQDAVSRPPGSLAAPAVAGDSLVVPCGPALAGSGPPGSLSSQRIISSSHPPHITDPLANIPLFQRPVLIVQNG